MSKSSENSINTLESQNDFKDEILLSDLINIFKRRKKIIAATAGFGFLITSITVGYLRLLKPIYKASFSLLISDPINRNKSSNAASFGNLDGLNIEIDTSLFENINSNNSGDTSSLIAFLKSYSILNPIAQKNNFSYDELNSKIKIQKSIVNNKKADGVIDINLFWKNKKEARELIDNISKSFLETSLKFRQEGLKEGLEFIEKQFPLLDKKRNDVLLELENLRKNNSFVNPELDGEALIQKKNLIIEEKRTLDKEKSQLLSIKQGIIDGTLSASRFQDKVSGGLTISDVDPKLLQELFEVEKKLAEAKSTFKTGSNYIKNIEERYIAIKPAVIENQLDSVNSTLKLNSSKNANLDIQLSEVEKEIQDNISQIKLFEKIKSDLLLANQNYLALTSTKDKFKIEYARENYIWKIINPPKVNPRPVKPLIFINLSIGILLSFIVAFLVAIFKDKSINAFNESEDAENKLKLNLLGDIPNYEKVDHTFKGSFDLNLFFKELIFEKIGNPKFQEAINICANNIYNLKIKSEPLSIVTSSLNYQPQFIINFFLSKTLAEQGLKVLLVDCNLRKCFNIKNGNNNAYGFSDYFRNGKLKIKDIAIGFNECPNLNFISSGNIQPNDFKFLLGENFNSFKHDINIMNFYDLIIYQVPPSLELFDIFKVSKEIDGLIYYVNLKYTNKQNYINFIRKLNNQNLNISGMVTNSFKEDKYFENLDIEKNNLYKYFKSLLKFKSIGIINKFYKWFNS